jgi:hypothetical protein
MDTTPPSSSPPRQQPPRLGPVPGWMRFAGWAALLLPLPSVLWRVAMLSGADVGLGLADFYRSTAGTVAYVLALDAAQVLAAVLTFGLICGWSETVPQWVPGLRGRRIPPLLPGVLGSAGAAALLWIIGVLLFAFVRSWLGITDGWTPDEGMGGGHRALLFACYLPFLLWPLAAAATVAGHWARFRRRGRGAEPPAARAGHR